MRVTAAALAAVVSLATVGAEAATGAPADAAKIESRTLAERARDRRMARSRHTERSDVSVVSRRQPQRVPGHHRDLALFRAHDVQRHQDACARRVRPDHGGQWRTQQRLHELRRHGVPGLVSAQRARARLRPRGGPDAESGFRSQGGGERARRRVLGAPILGGQRQLRRTRGADTGDRLRRAPVPVSDHRLAVRHRGMDDRGPENLLPALLRAQQRRGSRRWRRHCSGGVRARGEAPGADQGAARARAGHDARAAAARRAPAQDRARCADAADRDGLACGVGTRAPVADHGGAAGRAGRR